MSSVTIFDTKARHWTSTVAQGIGKNSATWEVTQTFEEGWSWLVLQGGTQVKQKLMNAEQSHDERSYQESVTVNICWLVVRVFGGISRRRARRKKIIAWPRSCSRRYLIDGVFSLFQTMTPDKGLNRIPICLAVLVLYLTTFQVSALGLFYSPNRTL